MPRGGLLDGLIKKIKSSESVDSDEAAIRIAKDRGWIKQKGSELALTDKGMKTARK